MDPLPLFLPLWNRGFYFLGLKIPQKLKNIFIRVTPQFIVVDKSINNN